MRYFFTVVVMVVGCRESGFFASDTEEWARAIRRAEQHGLLASNCRDETIMYQILTPEEWYDEGLPSGAEGVATPDSDVVYVLGTGNVSQSLEHEFLHKILQCSGSQTHGVHLGQVWEGL